ncbi:MAG: zinc ribbon domain-containing protein [Tannerella sp.]|nr:zinc ribbon domain-containing protein [Tannerella sp.]
MIFISGSSSSLIKSETSYHTTCPFCGHTGDVVFYVRGKYFYFMFIPCFPNGRDLYMHCTKCNSSLEYSEMSQELKSEIFEFSNKQRRSLFHYTGLLLFLFTIISFILLVRHSDSQQADYIKNPQINDLYNISIESDGYYSIMRIENISGDSVYFSVNKYSVRQTFKLDKININENYDVSNLRPVAIKDLDLKEVDEISLYSIKRPDDKKRQTQTR